MKENNLALTKRMLLFLDKAGHKGLTSRELAAKLKLKKGEGSVKDLLDGAKKEGLVVEKKGRCFSARTKGCYTGEMLRLHRTFGFARLNKEERDIFIPGGGLHGALPGDQVLLRLSKGKDGNLDEGEVVQVLSEGNPDYIGTVHLTGRGGFADVEGLSASLPLTGSLKSVEDGDRVLVRILRQGKDSRDFAARIVSAYGSSQRADSCAAAILDAAGITPDFPLVTQDEARYLAHRGIPAEELVSRLDLRGLDIFTIDGADSKDLDDAIYVEKGEDGWKLSVHIADVSHYVRAGSTLDAEAFRRGTSVYYADQVIPMLPKELSNGICSLNPGEDRLCFSALMELSADGKLLRYEFHKSVISSRVKGVYSEVNRLLDGDQDEALLEKYRAVLPQLPLIRELGAILRQNQLNRGAPVIESAESKIIIGEDGLTSDIQPRCRGEAEEIIESFMLAANEAAARTAREAEIPFVYRVHEVPAPDKVETLRIILKALGEDTSLLKKDKVPVSSLSAILNRVKGKPSELMINRQVLRSMMKARYSEHPLGHYGLALADYAHFTSPIRRYPDLAIHRILSDLVSPAAGLSEIRRRYRIFAVRAAARSSETELTAMQTERSCEDCYKAEYMKGRVGECFDGIISGVASYGFYVALPSTVEGLVRVDSLPEGSYQFDDMMQLTEEHTGRRYRVGDAVRVQCTAADVSSGKIDFILSDV